MAEMSARIRLTRTQISHLHVIPFPELVERRLVQLAPSVREQILNHPLAYLVQRQLLGVGPGHDAN